MQQNLVEIIDDYEHIEPELEYVLENVLLEINDSHSADIKDLYSQYNSVLVNKCECSHPAKCNEVKCVHGKNYKRAECDNELVLDVKEGLDTIYECSTLCKCDQKVCENRLAQYGPRRHLLIIDSERYGSKGLMTTKDIPCGGFVCEYAGELLTLEEAKRRTAENEQNSRMNYILCMNEMSRHKEGITQMTIVDPSRRGNIGRYLNHSCEPNCYIFSVRVDCPVPKIGIFANRKILAGEELCFHYGGELYHGLTNKVEPVKNFNGTPCLCGSGKCSKILPHKEFL